MRIPASQSIDMPNGSAILAGSTEATREDRGPQPAAAPREPTPPLPSIALLAILTFASGCAALVFQVAWMRELRLVFGATTASVAAVLAIFMAGIGAGSAVLGKRADRVANPLRMYGTLEKRTGPGPAFPRCPSFLR